MRARTVNEILKFERGLDPKQSMGICIYTPGNLFKYGDRYSVRKEFPSIFCYIESDKKYNYYFYIGRFINEKESFTGSNFTFGGSPGSDNRYNLQNKKDDHMTPITHEERIKLKKEFSSENAETILPSFEDKMKTKILLESINFERGGEIKDKLFGFRPGQIIKRELPMGNINSSELFVFIEEKHDHGPGFDMEAFQIGKILWPLYLKTTGEKDELKRPAKVIISFSSYPVLTNTSMIKPLTKEEKILVLDALKNDIESSRMEEVKKITGVTPFVA
jgi:hypothetical protein